MDLRPQITVKNKSTGEKRLYRMDQNQVTIGRDRSNYIVLESRTVSRKHTEVSEEGGQYFVRDLKSNNGTRVYEKKISPQEKLLLKSNDVIQIEDFDLLFHLPKPGEQQDLYEITDSDLLEVKMVKKLLKAMDKDKAPSLEILEGAETGRRFVLEGKNQDLVMGRDPAAEFCMDSNVISRKHARLQKRFDTVLIEDLDSKNGTYVNRERIKEKRLQDGDIIHLGTLGLIFHNPQELEFDLAPPKLSVPLSESSSPKIETSSPTTPPPHSGTLESRVSRKHEGELPLENQHSLEEPAPKLSPAEMTTLVIGLCVLVGAIWGILKLLK